MTNWIITCEHKFLGDGQKETVQIAASTQEDAERMFTLQYPHYFINEIEEDIP